MGNYRDYGQGRPARRALKNWIGCVFLAACLAACGAFTLDAEGERPDGTQGKIHIDKKQEDREPTE